MINENLDLKLELAHFCELHKKCAEFAAVFINGIIYRLNLKDLFWTIFCDLHL